MYFVCSSFELCAELRDLEPKMNAALLMKEKGITSMESSNAQDRPPKTTL